MAHKQNADHSLSFAQSTTLVLPADVLSASATYYQAGLSLFGGDLDSDSYFSTSDWSQCYAACHARKHCGAWSLESGVCWLKNPTEWTGLSSTEAIAGIMIRELKDEVVPRGADDKTQPALPGVLCPAFRVGREDHHLHGRKLRSCCSLTWEAI